MPDAADVGTCEAVSQPGTPVTVYIHGQPRFTVARPDRYFACTQDDRDHAGRHSACDGEGHILAKWPRKDPEQYWQRGDCAGHSHG